MLLGVCVLSGTCPPDISIQVQQAAGAAPAYQAARQRVAIQQAHAGVQEAHRVLALVQCEVQALGGRGEGEGEPVAGAY